MNARIVKRHQKQAAENHNKTTALERSVMNYWGTLSNPEFIYSKLVFAGVHIAFYTLLKM